MGGSAAPLWECGVNDASKNDSMLVLRLEELRMIVFTSWKLVLYTVLGALVLSIVGSLLMTPQYRASAIIHISPVWGPKNLG